MSANDIAEECGYESAVDMIMSCLKDEDLLDMLREYLANDEDLTDMVQEIASDKHDWFDRDAAQADADDAAYQAYRDRACDE